jgi:hypothetical protein
LNQNKIEYNTSLYAPIQASLHLWITGAADGVLQGKTAAMSEERIAAIRAFWRRPCETIPSCSTLLLVPSGHWTFCILRDLYSRPGQSVSHALYAGAATSRYGSDLPMALANTNQKQMEPGVPATSVGSTESASCGCFSENQRNVAFASCCTTRPEVEVVAGAGMSVSSDNDATMMLTTTTNNNDNAARSVPAKRKRRI